MFVETEFEYHKFMRVRSSRFLFETFTMTYTDFLASLVSTPCFCFNYYRKLIKSSYNQILIKLNATF